MQSKRALPSTPPNLEAELARGPSSLHYCHYFEVNEITVGKMNKTSSWLFLSSPFLLLKEVSWEASGLKIPEIPTRVFVGSILSAVHRKQQLPAWFVILTLCLSSPFPWADVDASRELPLAQPPAAHAAITSGSCPGTPEMRRRQEEAMRRLASQVQKHPARGMVVLGKMAVLMEFPGSFPAWRRLETPCVQMLTWGASRDTLEGVLVPRKVASLKWSSRDIKYTTLLLSGFVFHSHPTFSLQMLGYDAITEVIVFFLQHWEQNCPAFERCSVWKGQVLYLGKAQAEC